LKNADAATAPFGFPKSRKKIFHPISSIAEFNYKVSECSCALACPAGSALGERPGLIFFGAFLYQDKKVHKNN
jgi:hypothetical protein